MTVLSDVVYRIQQVGSRVRKIVHFDRLKPYFGFQRNEAEETTPTNQETHHTPPQQVEAETDLDEWEIQTEPIAADPEPEETVTEEAEPDPPEPDPPEPTLRRSQRNRRPPQRYGVEDVYV